MIDPRIKKNLSVGFGVTAIIIQGMVAVMLLMSIIFAPAAVLVGALMVYTYNTFLKPYAKDK